MEVILLEKVANLGGLGEKVSVKSGFGRNFLIPQGKAVFASPENVKVFEERRAELEQQAAEKLAEAEARKAQVEALSEGVSISHRSGEEGRLFGSVGTIDIARACAEAGVEVHKSEIRLPQGRSASPASTRWICTCTPTWMRSSRSPSSAKSDQRSRPGSAPGPVGFPAAGRVAVDKARPWPGFVVLVDSAYYGAAIVAIIGPILVL